jgi:hypothetical protein
LIKSRSTTRRPNKEFAVAVTAKDWRGHPVTGPPAQFDKQPGNVIADRGVNAGIAYDAFLDMAATRFELRLDQGEQRRGRF